MDVAAIQQSVGNGMSRQGFHRDFESGVLRKEIGFRLALIHTEVSEATQVIKRQVKDGDKSLSVVTHCELAAELADVAIRLFDLAYLLDIDMATAIDDKMAVNMQRPRLYGTAEAEVKPG